MDITLWIQICHYIQRVQANTPQTVWWTGKEQWYHDLRFFELFVLLRVFFLGVGLLDDELEAELSEEELPESELLDSSDDASLELESSLDEPSLELLDELLVECRRLRLRFVSDFLERWFSPSELLSSSSFRFLFEPPPLLFRFWSAFCKYNKISEMLIVISLLDIFWNNIFFIQTLDIFGPKDSIILFISQY